MERDFKLVSVLRKEISDIFDAELLLLIDNFSKFIKFSIGDKSVFVDTVKDIVFKFLAYCIPSILSILSEVDVDKFVTFSKSSIVISSSTLFPNSIAKARLR